MAELQTELTTDPLGLGLVGAAPEIALALLNKPGTASAPARVLSDSPVEVSAKTLALMLASANRAAFQRLYESDTDEGAEMRLLYNPNGVVDVAHKEVRAVLTKLAPVVITSDQLEAVLNLGMVKMSRAQELLGRPATLEDINGN